MSAERIVRHINRIKEHPLVALIILFIVVIAFIFGVIVDTRELFDSHNEDCILELHNTSLEFDMSKNDLVTLQQIYDRVYQYMDCCTELGVSENNDIIEITKLYDTLFNYLGLIIAYEDSFIDANDSVSPSFHLNQLRIQKICEIQILLCSILDCPIEQVEDYKNLTEVK